jgi:ketosteroid isomerase-like protein
MKLIGKWLASTGIVLAVSFVLGLATFPCFAYAADTPTVDQQAEATIRQASAQEVKAFMDKDAVQLASLWSDDMVVTNPLNKFVSKRQVLDMVQSGVLTFTAYERVIEYAHVYGNTVILAGHETVTWGSKMPHAGKTEHLLFTAVWMKRAGQWQEVARHANVVPPAPM